MSSILVVDDEGFSSIEGAIHVMREGAFDYIPKPFKNDHVLVTVARE